MGSHTGKITESLPHDLDLEVTTLGTLICPGNTDSKTIAKNELAVDDFYNSVHKHIYAASLEAQDVQDLASILQKRGVLEEVGGKTCLTQIASRGGIPAALPHHIETLKELSQRRKLIILATQLTTESYDLTADIQEILSKAAKALRKLHDHRQDPISNWELANIVFKDIEKRSQQGIREVGVLIGLDAIDDCLYGFERKTLTYIIGRPSMGKTALALNMAGYIADNYPGKVLFYSLEMGKEAIFRRRLASYSGIFLTRLRTGNIREDQWPDLIRASEELAKSDLLIVDDSRYKVVENLVAHATALATEHRLSALFIDHIQKMRTKGKANNRHLEISHISNELTTLAKELDVPVIVASQLNRQVEVRPDKKPKLSDMKESGDLEQDADLVLGIHRREHDSELMEIACLKGRDVGLWRSTLRFDGKTQRCEDIENEAQL